MDDKVGGLELKYVFNREGSEKTNPNIVISSETQQQKDGAKGEPQKKDTSSLLERNRSFKESDKSHDQPLKRIKSDDKCVEPVVARDFEKWKDMPSMKSTVDKVDKGGMKVGIVPVQRVANNERNKSPTGSDKLSDRPSKKFKSDDRTPPVETRVGLEVAHNSERFMEMSSKKLAVDSKSNNGDKSRADVNNFKASGKCGTTEDRKNSTISSKVTSVDLEGKSLKRTMDDGSFKVPGNKNVKEAKVPAWSTDKDKKDMYREFVVTPKERSDWLKRPLFDEDRLKNAYSQGTAILLHNVDPGYNSREVEDIIWHAFKENCDAKILQHTSVSSPHYAQALILLKKKEAAQKILKKLDDGCLMLTNGRPLVGTPCPPISTKKNSIVFGHLAIDKARFQNQREDEAVSTSHFSQPNTIEYDMAMEWCFLQFKSTKWWEKFHEKQGLELENLKNTLKKYRA